jgi:hypothetical protein
VPVSGVGFPELAQKCRGQLNLTQRRKGAKTRNNCRFLCVSAPLRFNWLENFVKKTSLQKQTLGLAAIIGVLGLIWLGMTWPDISQSKEHFTFSPSGKQARANKSITSNASINKLQELETLGENPTTESGHILDRSPLNNGLLISKRSSEQEQPASRADAFGELWFHDENGAERLIAREVVTAKFSPDGRKIAYSNRKQELIIETLDGQSLAQIPRAFDPSWCSDSSSVSFLAIPSLDYPELQQRSIYDLHSGEIAQAGNETTH